MVFCAVIDFKAVFRLHDSFIGLWRCALYMAFLCVYTVFPCPSVMLSVYAVISCEALKAFLNRFRHLACLCTYKAVHALILALRGSERVFCACVVCCHALPSGMRLPCVVVCLSVLRILSSCLHRWRRCVVVCLCLPCCGVVVSVSGMCLPVFRYRQKSNMKSTFHSHAVTFGSWSIRSVRTASVSAPSEISGSGMRFSKKSDQFSHQRMDGWLSDNAYTHDAHMCTCCSLIMYIYAHDAYVRDACIHM